MPPKFTPVEYDPFAKPAGGVSLTPVDYDPFSGPAKPTPAPAKQGPKWYDGVPTKPVAAGPLGYADQLYRTFAGAAADTADAVSGLVNRPINSVLSAVGSDFQLPVDQVGGAVPQPVGVGGQIARAFTPFIIAPAATEAKLVDAASDIARAPQVARIAAETPRLAERVGRGVVSGAPLDAGMAPKQDTNVSNLVQTATGVPIPTARSATDTPAVSAIKDVVEGAVLSGAVDAAAHFFLRGARAAPGTPQAALEEEQVLQAVQDPNVRAQLEASGITPESTPRYAEFVAKAEARQAEQAARAADPFANAEPPTFKPTPRPEGAPAPMSLRATPPDAEGRATISPSVVSDRAGQTLDYRDAQRAAAADLEARTQLPPEDPARVDPGALPRAGVEPPAPEVPLRVTQDGQAFVPDEGALRGQDLRKPSNLPVVVEPQPRAMSDVEVAQARRMADAGNLDGAVDRISETGAKLPPGAEAPPRPLNPRPDAQLRGGEAPPERSVTYAPDRPQRALPAPEPMRVTPEGQAFDPRGDVPGAAQPRAPEPDIKPDIAPAAEAPRAEAPPAPKPSSTVAAAPVGGRFAVDESGQVVSNKGGPVRFATEAQAQKWTQNVGAKKAPGQAFEIAPAGKGFTVKEKAAPETLAGRSPAPPVPPAPPAGEPTGLAPEGVRYSAEAKTADVTGARAETGADVGQRQPLPDTPEPKTAPGSTPEAANSSRVEQSDSGYMTPSKAVDQSGPARAEAPLRNAPETGRESDVGQQQSAPSARRAAAEAAEPVPDRETPAENAREARTGELSQEAPARRAQAEAAEAVPDREAKAENAQEARTGEPSDGELTDEQLQRIHERMKQKPTKLYSNPLDPEALDEHLVQPLKALISREVQGIKEGVQSLKALTSALMSSASPKALAQGTAAVIRKIWWTNVAAMRAIGGKYEGQAKELVNKFADLIGTDPGRGRVVEQVYERAVQMTAGNRSNAMSNILGTKVDVETERKVLEILSGRKRALTGTREATLAARLRALLDKHHDYLKEAGLDLGYVKGNYFPRVLDEDMVLKKPAEFKAAAERLYRSMGMSADEAKAAAQGWYDRVLGIRDGAYSSALPGSKATKGRTLPANAEALLVDASGKSFFRASLRDSLATYFNQTTRMAEFARRFGVNGEKATAAFNDMLRAGVDAKDVQQLRHNFESATGMAWSSRPGPGTEFLGWMQLHGTLKLLSRVVISSLSEGFSAGVRAHNLLAGFQTTIDSYRRLIGSVFDPDAAPDEAEQVARMLGIVGDTVNDMLLQSAYGGGELAGVGASAKIRADLMHKFFTVTGLHQLTEAQRTAALRVGQQFISELVSDVLSGSRRQKSAQFLLNELGIAEGDVEALNAWMKSGKDGALPMDGLLGAHPSAVKYRTALQRFVDETIQNPSAADKPEFANHPVGRLAYAITSFMFSYTRNVLVRTMRSTGEAVQLGKGYTFEDRLRFAAPSLALGMLAGATMGVNAARNEYLNKGTTSEQAKVQQVAAAASRASLFGNADPFVNILVSARYKRDLTSLLTGAYLTSDLADMWNMTAGLIPRKVGGVDIGGPNSPATNNAEWNAAKSAYAQFLAPSIALAASVMPGGPAMRMAYGAGMIAETSPDKARAFADKVAGERTIKPRGGQQSSTSDDSSGYGGGDDMGMSMELKLED